MNQTRFEYHLTIKKYEIQQDDFYGRQIDKKEVAVEELEYKSISAQDIVRKLLDYIR